MSRTYNDILLDVSYALIERLVNTKIQILSGSSGLVTISPLPGGMFGIYPGAMLFVGTPANVEAVTVIALVPNIFGGGFTAMLQNTHVVGEPITGVTFPSGQPLAPLFTQQEIIGYISDAQSDFLLSVRPIYNIVDMAVVAGQRFYPQPSDCIRLERVAINPDPTSYSGVTMDLYETSQASLDLSDPNWQGNQGLPAQWFRDDIADSQYGYAPLPSAAYMAELWYSQNITATGIILTTPLLVPDLFAHVLKYSVLAKCWTKDGETRDPMRADYCERRVKMITMLAVKFMTGAGVNMPTGTRGDPDFSPMPLQQKGA